MSLKKLTLYILAWGLLLISHLAIAQQTKILNGFGYDQHVELNWNAAYKPETNYRIKISVNGGKWKTRGSTSKTSFMDFVGEFGSNLKLTYKLYELNNDKEIELDTVSLKTRDFSDEELLEMVQQYTFRYFWSFAEEKTGWARERILNNDGDVITSGGTGFGIMAIIVGAERGWVSREAATKRLLKITNSLNQLERFHGMWAHWYNATTLKTFHFSSYDDGGDIVESALMAQGLLAARQYFNQNTEQENRLRNEITALWEAMEWSWYTQGKNSLTWHWSKKYNWKINQTLEGYNEALITYVLAASSPTYPISAKVYHQGWVNKDSDYFFNQKSYYGFTLPLGNKKEMGGPLFFAHYSFLGLDPRGLKDRYADYWQQNRNQTLINRAYCIDNPHGWKGYGESFWGLTAGDMVPKGYSAHAPGERDVGTITPTAALSSMPYTPLESMKVLKNIYYNHGKEAFGPMGFYDGINLSVSELPQNQVVKTYLAIDQGPIIVMLENYRSGLLWKYFMKDPEIKKGLKALEFTIDAKKIK